MREGKAIKAEALKRSQTGNKKKDEKIAKDAKRLLWGMLGKQWCLLLVGAPFMFLGSAIEFFAPHYIGQILDNFRTEDFTAVRDTVIEWVAVAAFTALCSALREGIFGVASQRLGRNLRQMFFEALMNKDVNFYDNFRTGDMLSRLSSDT